MTPFIFVEKNFIKSKAIHILDFSIYKFKKKKKVTTFGWLTGGGRKQITICIIQNPGKNLKHSKQPLTPPLVPTIIHKVTKQWNPKWLTGNQVRAVRTLIQQQHTGP